MIEEPTGAPNLSHAQEDYLKIILDLINSQRVARVKEIAQRKNVSMPTVTEAMRKMAQDGLINYSAHEYIDLTSQGEQAAQQMIGRHRFLQLFLEEILDIPTETANAEACLLEHQLSSITLERMILLYQFLTNCPHRTEDLMASLRQCLSIDGNSKNTDGRDCFFNTPFPHTTNDKHLIHLLLADLSEGQAAVVVMLGVNVEKLHEFISQGLVPGATLKMEHSGADDRPYVITINGLQIKIEPDLAKLIEVAIPMENKQ